MPAQAVYGKVALAASDQSMYERMSGQTSLSNISRLIFIVASDAPYLKDPAIIAPDSSSCVHATCA